ncbi:MAG: lamin tail domain-containing protein [Chitinophagales bacterium]|nr:lamin tail domain-containing protein [Chitinophagales bacterium]
MLKTIKIRIVFYIFLMGMITQIQAQDVEYREVVINEIMANPNPPVDNLPNNEYIEIYNRSNQNIDLTNWTLKDASTTVGVFSNANIAPHEYAIICKLADEPLFTPFGKVVTVNKWPALNNDKDSVVIRTATGQLVDAVYYSDTWYKDAGKKTGGYSLELINPTLNCSDDKNWIASKAGDGGTPGQKNSVEVLIPDTIAPIISQINILNSQSIQLTFSKSIDVVTAENTNLYIFTPSIEVASIHFNVERNIATIELSESLNPGALYNFHVFGINDCEGNALKDTTFAISIGQKATFNDILITEIMAKPTPVVGLPEVEYIELYNNSEKAIDLKGMVLKASTRTATFTGGTLLPHEYAVVTSSENVGLFSFSPKVIGLDKFPALTDGGAQLSLSNSDGSATFQITYSNAWYASSEKKVGGWSLEMKDLLQPCIERENWSESQDPKGGTPGQVNSVNGSLGAIASVVAGTVEFHDAHHIQILFSGKLHPNIIDDVSIRVEPHLEIAHFQIQTNTPDIVEIEFTDNIVENTIYKITIDGLYDCAGNAIKSSTLEFGIPQTVEPGDIIINELLYDPNTGGTDFVELLNISDKLLSVSDLLITREDPLTQAVITNTDLSSVKKLIFPGDYLVLSSKGENIRVQYNTPGVSVFADVSSFPNYVNDGGIVGLYRNDNTVLEKFEYNPKMHFKMLKVTKGVSLERINPRVSTEEVSNWNSAALSVGGATPGYKNSQYLQVIPKGKLSVSPEVFSPDNDGVDDVLGVSYQLDKADYVGSASVYTIEGIPVKTLFSQQTLSQEGFFTWDGLDKDDKKARVGIYVVVLELYNLKGKSEILRTKCVLAARNR